MSNRFRRSETEDHPIAELKNVQAIADLERTSRERRSRIECFSDAIVRAAGSLPFVVAHLVWFAAWIGFNATSRPFDAFPFSLLTLIVSLEAILLSALLLMTQNRQMRDADRRTHLDLQVNLLAEQELTAILRVLVLLAERSQINVAEEIPELAALARRTDVNHLANLVESTIESQQVASKP